MRTLSLLSLLTVICLYSTATFARICFLGDTKCQSGKFDMSVNETCRTQNSAWIYESEICEGLVYGSPVCNDDTGNYYNEGQCPSGYTDVADLNSRYECSSSLLCSKCCKNEDVRCTSEYKNCSNNSQGIDSGGDSVCQEPGGDIKYRECECDANIYFSKCEGTGVEGDYSDVCIDDDGATWFKACQCASGYNQAAYSNIKCSDDCKDNCRLGSYGQLPGTSSYCWEGAECLEDPTPVEQCPINYQSDFDTFWAGYDVTGDCQNLVVDCAVLGYNTGTAGSGAKCKDGTEPFRCPFDHTAVYCASGIEDSCEFYTKSDCELSYFGSNCTQDASQCYKPTSCKTGYVKDVETCKVDSGEYSLGNADEFGCAQCQKN